MHALQDRLDELARPPMRFIPEPHPITVMLLDDVRRGETAEAMIAVIHGTSHMVGINEFGLDVREEWVWQS